MAKVLKNYRFRHSGQSMYPWDKWLDGQIRQLTKGTDFDVSMQSMRTMVYYAAKARGMSVATSVVGDDLIIQSLVNVR